MNTVLQQHSDRWLKHKHQGLWHLRTMQQSKGKVDEWLEWSVAALESELMRRGYEMTVTWRKGKEGVDK